MAGFIMRFIRAGIYAVITWGSLLVLGANDQTTIVLSVLVFLMSLVNVLVGIMTLPVAAAALWAASHLLFGVPGLKGADADPDVRAGELTKKATQAASEVLGKAKGKAEEAVSEFSTVQRVKELKALRDEGLISEDEYTTLRNEIILNSVVSPGGEASANAQAD